MGWLLKQQHAFPELFIHPLLQYWLTYFWVLWKARGLLLQVCCLFITAFTRYMSALLYKSSEISTQYQQIQHLPRPAHRKQHQKTICFCIAQVQSIQFTWLLSDPRPSPSWSRIFDLNHGDMGSKILIHISPAEEQKKKSGWVHLRPHASHWMRPSISISACDLLLHGSHFFRYVNTQSPAEPIM